MSQIGGSYGWFIQLQKQYPTSALVTELVQIHQERFIVKAIVQISGVAIATSMAESASLETAEDQARRRVLDLLGISGVSRIPNLDSLPAPELVTVPIDRDQVPEIPPPEAPFPETSSLAISQPVDPGFPIHVLSSLDLELGVPAPLPFPEVSVPEVSVPEVSADLSMPVSTTPFSPEVFLAEDNTAEDNAAEDNTSEMLNDFEEEYLPSVEEYGAGYEEREPEDAFMGTSLIEAETVAIASPPEAKQSDDFLTPLQSGKPKPAIAPENPIAPADATEPDDLSTLIAHTDVEMDRIGWTKQEGRDYLKRTYKKSTRQRLDVDELMDFLHYLRALPSVNGI